MKPDDGWSLEFHIEGQFKRARAGTLILPHGSVQTPVFMPVGTQGTIKGMTCEQVQDLGIHLILGNTYHLGHRPGGDSVELMGGLHQMMGWEKNLLTDSGGFQMVSLAKLSSVSEEGVQFQSPHDSSMMMLTPEHSMHLQQQIGSDIVMQLDDVVHTSVTGPRVEEAMHRSVRWLDRCIKCFQDDPQEKKTSKKKKRQQQNLFAIIQGGLDVNLRIECVEMMIQRNCPGYAIGGLSGGESKDEFWRIVHCVTPLLPPSKPRYVMGIGYAEDLVVCTALGCDMYDCVFPTRTARFGTALTFGGKLHLKNAEFSTDFSPIEISCGCRVCARYTRAFLHRGAGKVAECGQLITEHNLYFQRNLMEKQRRAVLEHTYDAWVRDFFTHRYGSRNAIPKWIIDAITAAGIDLNEPN